MEILLKDIESGFREKFTDLAIPTAMPPLGAQKSLKQEVLHIVLLHIDMIMFIISILLLKVAEDLMTIAYENGINLFDTAEVYNAGK